MTRKAFGIVSAFEPVKKRNDWQRPSGAKTWQSRVDYDAWTRIDPARLPEKAYVNRRMEDEIRAEIDRDAQLQKAKNKLAEQRKLDQKQE